MLGGIKVKGDGAEAGVPLFRVLAQRWKSLAPVQRKRIRLSSMSLADHQPAEPTRKWISKPRAVHAHDVVVQAKPKSTWNPWLWVK